MAMVPLGEGGYGEVWHLPDKEPQMVMKKVRQTNDTDSYLRYLKELKTLKDLIHENVVRYYDAPSTLNYPGINPDDLLLFMEYCEHLSLRHVIKDINLVYSMATIAQWSTEMFSALEYLKSMNIVHQDVKPANLFVHGPDYVLKLGDFGIVRDRNTIEKYRRGTPGYMPPKIEYDETQGGEDAYKYDIYGAGWVVLDIVNRRPGNRDIEEMFKDHRHLATLKRLVIGCTNEEVANRLSVEDALAHCKTMTKEFKKYHAKPDPDQKPGELKPPVGLNEKGKQADGETEEIHISGVDTTFSLSCSLQMAPKAKQNQSTVTRREKLLMDLKQQLGATAECGRFTMEDMLLCDNAEAGGMNHEYCLMSRRELCATILQKLLNLPFEDQLECAEEMERYWKVDAPELYKGVPERFLHDVRQVTIHSTGQLQESILEILGMFRSLIEMDVFIHRQYHERQLEALIETDLGTLPSWDILKHLDDAINIMKELGQLFAVRAIYPIVTIQGSRYSWYCLKEVGLLRKDCTDTRTEDNWPGQIAYMDTGEKEPLNNEQMRRALIDAKNSFVKNLLKQRDTMEMVRSNGRWESITMDALWWMDIFWLNCQKLLEEVKRIPDQPFPGYVFLIDHPPSHRCPKEECKIVGGFPSWADPKCQIHYHQCLTKEQIEYIEVYTLMLSSIQYIERRPSKWLPDFLDSLIEYKGRGRDWSVPFALVELYDGSNGLLVQYHPSVERGTFLNNKMKIVYSKEKVKFMRFVLVRLSDLQGIFPSRHICECFLLPWFIAARQDGTGTFWENVTNRKLDNAFEENISSPVEAILNEGESGETGDRTDRAE